jgi:hypothetical protein
VAVLPTGQSWKVPAFEKWLRREGRWFMFAIGRGEDVAAKKRPRLLPQGARSL